MKSSEHIEQKGLSEFIKQETVEADHVGRINELLARVFRREGYTGITTRTPFSELLEKENAAQLSDDESARDEWEIREARLSAFKRLLRFIFEDGPHPGCSMRRLYILARAYEPSLIMNMNGTDLAVMFDETRAAQSARTKLMFQKLSKKTGQQHGFHFNKRSGSSEKYAAAQMGNQNRRGKKIAALARQIGK